MSRVDHAERAPSEPGNVTRTRSSRCSRVIAHGSEDAERRRRPSMDRRIKPSFFAFADVRPIGGRIVHRDRSRERAARRGARRRVLARRLGADPMVLGKRITLIDSLYTIDRRHAATFWCRSRTEADGCLAARWPPRRKGGRVPASSGDSPRGATRSAQRELDAIVARVAGFTSGRDPVQGRRLDARGGASVSRFADVADGRRRARAAGRLRERRASCCSRDPRRGTRDGDSCRAGRGRGSSVLGSCSRKAFCSPSAGTVAGFGLGWLGVKGLVAHASVTRRPRARISMARRSVSRCGATRQRVSSA